MLFIIEIITIDINILLAALSKNTGIFQHACLECPKADVFFTVVVKYYCFIALQKYQSLSVQETKIMKRILFLEVFMSIFKLD